MQPTQRRNDSLSPRAARAMAVVTAVCLLLGVAFALLRHYAEPIAKRRIIAELEYKLHSPVELDHVSVSVAHGLEVNGEGLRIASIANQARATPGGPPMLSVRSFQFTSTLGSLLLHHDSAVTAYAQGVVMTIPAGDNRVTVDPTSRPKKPRDSLLLNKLVATDSTLVVESADPGKPPIVLAFNKAILVDPGKDTPFVYETILTNPKPVGEIHSVGHIGPLGTGSLRQMPVDGNYTFDRTDLSTVNGLSGTLTSQGRMTGSLGSMAVHGTADVPDFALDISAHSFPVHAEFQALVDGTNGNVALQAVGARFLRTSATGNGTVTRATGTVPGHNIALDVQIVNGRAEDLLTLFSKSRPVLLTSAITLTGHVDVPPGKQRLVLKLHSRGTGSMTGMRFTKPDLQQTVDSLSARAEDHAKDAKDNPAAMPRVASTMRGGYIIAGGNVELAGLVYTLPGATVLMDGTYPLVDRELNFHGVARTIATAAHMETGLKSVLLRPISPFLKKNGAGMQIPVSFTGDKSSPHMALDLKNRKKDDAGPGSIPGTPRR